MTKCLRPSRVRRKDPLEPPGVRGVVAEPGVRGVTDPGVAEPAGVLGVLLAVPGVRLPPPACSVIGDVVVLSASTLKINNFHEKIIGIV